MDELENMKLEDIFNLKKQNLFQYKDICNQLKIKGNREQLLKVTFDCNIFRLVRDFHSQATLH